MIPKATEMTDSKKPRMIRIAISAPKVLAPHWAVVMIPQMRTWVALSSRSQLQVHRSSLAALQSVREVPLSGNP
jgi:hypothetical protein